MHTSKAESPKPSPTRKGSKDTSPPTKQAILEVIQSMLHRYQEAGGRFYVINLETQGGIGVFLPGVQVVEGSFCEITENSQNEALPEGD